ncbi:MAG: hypothetical protein NC307_01455 [Roseburia sp.]|nr:hypothetical protein [Roseburia sp.]
MTNLEKLYYNLHNLMDKTRDSEEVRKASNNVENALGDELFAKYEDEITDYASASQKQGFITGFKYAVSLMTSGKEVSA